MRATEAGLTAEAFRDRPVAAESWLNLMRSNDLVGRLASCTGKAVVAAAGALGVRCGPVARPAPEPGAEDICPRPGSRVNGLQDPRPLADSGRA